MQGVSHSAQYIWLVSSIQTPSAVHDRRIIWLWQQLLLHCWPADVWIDTVTTVPSHLPNQSTSYAHPYRLCRLRQHLETPKCCLKCAQFFVRTTQCISQHQHTFLTSFPKKTMGQKYAIFITCPTIGTAHCGNILVSLSKNPLFSKVVVRLSHIITTLCKKEELWAEICIKAADNIGLKLRYSMHTVVWQLLKHLFHWVVTPTRYAWNMYELRGFLI